jgi:hypothetical protein
MNFIIVDRRLGEAQRNPTIPMKTLGYANATPNLPKSPDFTRLHYMYDISGDKRCSFVIQFSRGRYQRSWLPRASQRF